MRTNRTIGNHEHETAPSQPLHLSLGSRAMAALTAGCLALSLCPALAFAAPSGEEAGQQGGNAPIEQQGPSGKQGPSNQMPNDNGSPNGGSLPAGNRPHFEEGQSESSNPPGQPAEGQWADAGSQAPADNAQPPRDDASQNGEPQAPEGENEGQPDYRDRPMERPEGSSDMDDQVREILAENYGMTANPPAPEGMADPVGAGDNANAEGDAGAAAGNRRQPPELSGNAPEIPEGEPNVQEIIDTTRDIVREYGADALAEADFDDQAFLTKLAEYANSAIEQRMEMFKKGIAPHSNAESAPAEDAQPISGAPSNETASATVLEKVVSFLASLFGVGAE